MYLYKLVSSQDVTVHQGTVSATSRRLTAARAEVF